MNASLKPKLVAGAAATLSLVGAGMAVAAGSGSGGSTITNAAQGATSFVSSHTGNDPSAAPGDGRGAGCGGNLSAAASYLGLTTSALQSRLESGKTLTQIADATSGKSAKGLIAALVAAEKKEIAAAVAAGRLTQAQADSLNATLQQRVTDRVNGTFPAHGAEGGHGPRHGSSSPTA